MSKLALFYLLLSTNPNMMHDFNTSSVGQKETMLKKAGVINAHEVSRLSNEQVNEILVKDLVSQTNSWFSLERSAGNQDNKNNIGRLGLKRR